MPSAVAEAEAAAMDNAADVWRLNTASRLQWPPAATGGIYVAPARMRAAAIPDSSLYQKNDTNIKETIGGVFLKVEITEKEKAAIERGLNQGGGAPEVTVKVENGKVVVLKVEKKKIV